MGQLEKYGLYVLCLVIFLILGVTIWGGGDVAPGKSPAASIRSAAPGGGTPAPTPAPSPMAEEMKSLAEVFLDQPQAPRRETPQGGGDPKGGQPVGTASGTKDPVEDPKTTKETPKDPGAGGAKTAPSVRATYRVQEGDSFDSIARTKLGRAAARDELMRLNPGIDPRKLRPGTELVLPAADAVAGGKPAEASARKGLDKPLAPPADGGRTYVVKKGDNFERIAIAELGSKKRTSELLELNVGIDPTKLRPGTTLKLPKK